MLQDSVLLTKSDPAWRPKMIVLHNEGAKFVARWGGEKMGLYSKMTRADWAEIMPQPDWNNNARSLYTFGSDLSDGHEGSRVKWTAESAWPTSKGATTRKPSPTSTRFFIVSTNKSWENNVYQVAIESLNPYANMKREADKYAAENPSHMQKIRDRYCDARKELNLQFLNLASLAKQTGSRPTRRHAVRHGRITGTTLWRLRWSVTSSTLHGL